MTNQPPPFRDDRRFAQGQYGQKHQTGVSAYGNVMYGGRRRDLPPVYYTGGVQPQAMFAGTMNPAPYLDYIYPQAMPLNAYDNQRFMYQGRPYSPTWNPHPFIPQWTPANMTAPWAGPPNAPPQYLDYPQRNQTVQNHKRYLPVSGSGKP